MTTTKLITIEGPTGVGKTSLAVRVAKTFGWHAELEVFEDNPFLPRYYGNGEKCAFQMEMFFLNSRYKQVVKLREEYLNKGISVIADYHILKNLIFAQLTLDEEEFPIFEQMYNYLSNGFPSADLIIFLNASVKTLQYRQSKRGRLFEQGLQSDYLEQLCSSFKAAPLMYSTLYPDRKQITIDTNGIDFVANRKHFETILEMVSKALQG